MSASSTRLPALSHKYRLLSDLRRANLPDPEGALRPLSREFPGALRELDSLPLPLLDQRLAAVVEAERGGVREPCSPAFVARVAKPPGGRLNHLVFELLEQRFGRPRAELEPALFPRESRA